MSYQARAGEASAVLRRDADVPGLVRPTSRSRFVAPGSVTDGRFGLFRWEKGGIHAFNNESSREPAAMLILFAPAPPRADYFIGLAEISDSGRDLSPEEWAAFLAKHDQYSA